MYVCSYYTPKTELTNYVVVLLMQLCRIFGHQKPYRYTQMRYAILLPSRKTFRIELSTESLPSRSLRNPFCGSDCIITSNICNCTARPVFPAPRRTTKPVGALPKHFGRRYRRTGAVSRLRRAHKSGDIVPMESCVYGIAHFTITFRIISIAHLPMLDMFSETYY